jgi:G:T-mismatch repair DNA endonuclease (very short patch repair protein)
MNDLMDRYDVERISRDRARILKSDRNRPSRDELIERYDRSSIGELLEYYGIGYGKLMRWFEQYGIEKRKRGGTASIKHTLRHESIKPTYEVLKEEYERQSIYELSLKYGVDKHVVSNWLTSYDIDVTTNSSRAENELFEYCKSLDDSFVQHDRSLIGPLELDIVSHKYKLAIEYCGIYWHSETMGKSKQYHREKYLRCRELGYRLLTVFETDDTKKIRALIRTHVGSNQRVYARNTTITEVDSRIANRFHRDHHLSNAIGGSVHLGLYYNDELVMVATFSKTRYNRNVQYECARMTSHSKYTIVGGASRLFKYFFRNYDVESCITYADLRFGEGRVYEHCGFTRHGDSQPNYFYFKTNELLLQSRVKYQKHKLEKLLSSYDPSLSEYNNMIANGYHRIWDCGNAVYIYDP